MSVVTQVNLVLFWTSCSYKLHNGCHNVWKFLITITLTSTVALYSCEPAGSSNMNPTPGGTSALNSKEHPSEAELRPLPTKPDTAVVAPVIPTIEPSSPPAHRKQAKIQFQGTIHLSFSDKFDFIPLFPSCLFICYFQNCFDVMYSSMLFVTLIGYVYQMGRLKSYWRCWVCCPLWSHVKSAAWSSGSHVEWVLNWMDIPSRVQATSETRRRPAEKPSIYLPLLLGSAHLEQVLFFVVLYVFSLFFSHHLLRVHFKIQDALLSIIYMVL